MSLTETNRSFFVFMIRNHRLRILKRRLCFSSFFVSEKMKLKSHAVDNFYASVKFRPFPSVSTRSIFQTSGKQNVTASNIRSALLLFPQESIVAVKNVFQYQWERGIGYRFQYSDQVWKQADSLYLDGIQINSWNSLLLWFYFHLFSDGSDFLPSPSENKRSNCLLF